MGKLALLKAALAKGYLVLVILAVVNTAIAAYYYLGVIREAFFRDAGDRPLIPLGAPVRALPDPAGGQSGPGNSAGARARVHFEFLGGVTGLEQEHQRFTVDPAARMDEAGWMWWIRR
jgi:hypothetical protein